MRTFGSPFSLCLFEPRDAASPELDKALKIYRANISPLLSTLSNQIRAKVASPSDPAGCFYFAALMRGKPVIGFALFGHHPSKRIIVIDHLVVDRHCRGENAFYSFAQLLREAIDKLGLEFDFIVVEVDKANDYGGRQTGGPALVRLLGLVNGSIVEWLKLEGDVKELFGVSVMAGVRAPRGLNNSGATAEAIRRRLSFKQIEANPQGNYATMRHFPS